MSDWLIRIAFLVLMLGGGILIGILTAPGDWYAQLSKPAFNPPNWIFGPVWTALYVLIAMAGWRQFEADRSSAAMKLWWAQMGLNFLWSPTFFVLQMPWVAFVVIVALLAVIFVFIARVRNSDPVSALAFLPYCAWVAFATALNLSIAILN
ncbi:MULTISPECIES: TspO/MBR family protein [unclassified Ruegeria]|uniref:TspO/MBR family protein n=1 Tax=unclassified Ruegeria TaxID=2625375 RepID=UPI001268BB20|nr:MULTISPECIES: TspO/MBR family protein [unclassified Ruegeria]NOD99633.1 tryptophan-rich sensory protein [Ruegeria sp. HKCCD6228]QFT71415.1 TspO/MBR family protein [Ruegeria sp. THAF33]